MAGFRQLVLTVVLTCGHANWLAAADAFDADALDAEQVRQATVKLLDAGFQDHSVSAAELDKVYLDGVHHLGHPHPYLDYAYWLVLSKNLTSRPAMDYLMTAAKSTSPLVLPAREELIRSQIEAGHYEEAIEMLVDLSQLVGKISEDQPTAADAHRSAFWIGQILAFLQGPAGIEKVAKRAASVEAPIRTLLGDRYQEDFQKGRAAVVAVQREFIVQLNAALRQAELKKTQTQDALQEKKETITQRQEALAETADKVQTSFKEQLSGFDDKLKVMDRQFTMSLESEQRLQAAQILLQGQINQLQQQLRLNQNSSTNNRLYGNWNQNNNLQQALAAAEAQYALTVNQYALLLQSRYELARQAQTLIAGRQAVAAQFQSTKGEMQNQQALMNRWQTRLDQVAKLEAQAPPTKEPTVNSIRRRISNLSNYDEGSFTEQRRMLSDLLEMTAPGAAN